MDIVRDCEHYKDNEMSGQGYLFFVYTMYEEPRDISYYILAQTELSTVDRIQPLLLIEM
jgi:hypothetical protein